jgi:hypothetical protein
MSQTTTGTPQADAQEAEYRAIEVTFAETARGRWFLDEFARRHRGAETALVLEAIEQLRLPPPDKDAGAADIDAGRLIESLQTSLAEIAGLIAQDTGEAALTDWPSSGEPARSEGFGSAERILQEAERATSNILDAAENIQEVAWTLRERGTDGAVCDLLDDRASEIYAACAIGDAAARRLRVLLRSLPEIQARLDALRQTCQGKTSTELPVADEQPQPAPSAGAAEQPEEPEPAVEPETHATRFASEPAPAEQLDAGPSEAERRRREGLAILAEIDALPLHEKLRLFT